MIDPQLRVLSDKAFPELATALRDKAEIILERWEQKSREALPVADEMTLTQLRDHLPLVIEELGKALASTRPEAADEMDAAYLEHGEKRFRQRYNVDELLAEYEVLRAVILDEVSKDLGRYLNRDEALALHAGIDRAIRRSVSAFVDHLAKQLKATDDLQSHYISFLNHDLRGGMNGILLMVEVLKRELAPEARFGETVDDLDTMRRAVLDSVATMDRFVFAHRLSRGKHQPKFTRFPLKPILTDLVGHFSHGAKERKIAFNIQAEDGLVLHSDRELVRLILQNLLMNTIKHAPKTGGVVNVTVTPGNGGTAIAVSDQGALIPAGQIESIYTLSLEEPGHGKKAVKLGLPVSKLAANLIGGTLSVETSPTGNTFTLVVPERQA